MQFEKNKLIIVFIVLFQTLSNAQSFLNPSLENWAFITQCDTNTAPDGWENYSNGGLGPDEVNFLSCSTTVPSSAANGNVYARMYAANATMGEGMYQYVNGLTVGNQYQISFDFSGSNYSGLSSGQIQYHLFIDDLDVSQTPVFLSSDSTWNTFSYSFITTNYSHKIGVRLYKLAGNGSGAIDAFNFTNTTSVENDLRRETLISIYPNPTSGVVSIVFNSMSPNKTEVLEIYDLSSALVLKQNVDRAENISLKLNAGLYFITIINENGIRSKAQKIIVTR